MNIFFYTPSDYTEIIYRAAVESKKKKKKKPQNYYQHISRVKGFFLALFFFLSLFQYRYHKFSFLG